MSQPRNLGSTAGRLSALVALPVTSGMRVSRGAGIVFEKSQLNPRYAIYHCFLRDPSGYLIEIQRFEDPRWAPPRRAGGERRGPAA